MRVRVIVGVQVRSPPPSLPSGACWTFSTSLVGAAMRPHGRPVFPFRVLQGTLFGISTLSGSITSFSGPEISVPRPRLSARQRSAALRHGLTRQPPSAPPPLPSPPTLPLIRRHGPTLVPTLVPGPGFRTCGGDSGHGSGSGGGVTTPNRHMSIFRTTSASLRPFEWRMKYRSVPHKIKCFFIQSCIRAIAIQC